MPGVENPPGLGGGVTQWGPGGGSFVAVPTAFATSRGTTQGTSSSTSKSQSTSGPVATPQSQLSLLLSKAAEQTGQEVYQWAQSILGPDQAITDQAIGHYLSSALTQEGLANQTAHQYYDVTAPQITEQANQAATYNSAARQQFAAGQAEAQSLQGSYAGLQNAEQQLQSYGIRPDSGVYQALNKATQAAAGASAAASGTQAAQNVEATGRQMLGQSIAAGQQLPGQSVNSANAATQAVSGAQNAQLANTTTGAQALGAAQPYMQTASNQTTESPSSQSTSTSASQSQESGTNTSTQMSATLAPNNYIIGSGFLAEGGAIPVQQFAGAGGVKTMKARIPAAPMIHTLPAGKILGQPFGSHKGGRRRGGGGGPQERLARPPRNSPARPQPPASSDESDGDTQMSGGGKGGGGHKGGGSKKMSGGGRPPQEKPQDLPPATGTSFNDAMSSGTPATPPNVDSGIPTAPRPAIPPTPPSQPMGSPPSMASPEVMPTPGAMPGSFAQGGIPSPMATTGGHVNRNLSPSHGAQVDDIPAQLNADEFVMPRDVAKYYGQKTFQDMILKARRAMGSHDQSPAKPSMGVAQGGPPRFVSQHMQGGGSALEGIPSGGEASGDSTSMNDPAMSQWGQQYNHTDAGSQW